MNKRFEMQYNESIRTDDKEFSNDTIRAFVKSTIEDAAPKKVLIIPPDCTRNHSFGGKLTEIYYDIFKDTCEVDILPALGTHLQLTDEEIDAFFGDKIPKSCFLVHNWRTSVVSIGQVPADFISEATEGQFDEPIEISINKRLLDDSYDMVISIGQVVPHAIAGIANYSKNILVGCGGQDIINNSHFIGAVYGMEKILGKVNNPVRAIFDYAQKHFLDELKINYVFTVTSVSENGVELEGLYGGMSRKVFERASEMAIEKDIFMLDKKIDHVVAYLEEEEFKSTWLGNKAVYRSRMAIADGGKLTILAPGVKMFGEDAKNDELIRKYGYAGKQQVLSFMDDEDMKSNLSAAAHLIHGSTEGRFEVEYAAPELTKEEIEAVGYTYVDYDTTAQKYDIDVLSDGYNEVDGETIFFIRNPALGLWACKEEWI